MAYIEVKSSTLAAIKYDAEESVLCVRFRSGDEYEYQGVPESVYQGILKARSVGKYFDQHVKKAGYRYRQLK